MDIRKAMKMAPALLLIKSHVKEYQRRTKSGGVTAVKEHEDSRQSAGPRISRENVLKHIHISAVKQKESANNSSYERKAREMQELERVLPHLRNLYAEIKKGADIGTAIDKYVKRVQPGGDVNYMRLLQTGATKGFPSLEQQQGSGWVVHNENLAHQGSNDKEPKILNKWYYDKLNKSMVDAWEAEIEALHKSHVKAYSRRSKSGASSYVSEYERDAIAEGRKPSMGEFLHGREETIDGVHGHWKHTPAKVSKHHPLYGENWKEPEKIEHVPSAKGKQSKEYQAIRSKLGDDFVTEPSGERIVDAAVKHGYEQKYPDKRDPVQGLVDGIDTVSKTMLKNPSLKEHHAAITRKVQALKANPTAKNAHQVAGDLKLIIESAQKSPASSTKDAADKYAEKRYGIDTDGHARDLWEKSGKKVPFATFKKNLFKKSYSEQLADLAKRMRE